MHIDLIVDLQYGSTGKGLLAGYLAEHKHPVAVVNCNMPNAGHTYIDSKGNKMIHKVLPNGVVSDNLKYVLLGPGSVINLDRLHLEVQMCRQFGYLQDADIIIHPNAVILDDEHAKIEQAALSTISSTMQGSAPAQIEKMMRNPTSKILAKSRFAEINMWDGYKVVDHDSWMAILQSLHNQYVLAEGSQGFSLGLNQRFWPFCTSRECTPFRLLSDMGLPYTCERIDVYGTLRTFPIRVGNTPDGYSGDWYPDQDEVTWGEINQIPEKTTVTQRERRVATFSMDQLRESLFYCRPHYLFVNFVNYLTAQRDSDRGV
jgi:adenylosuccinate synthase